MSFFLSPIAVVLQYFSDQGIILQGGKIYTYLAGTTLPTPTYTDITGTVTNSNPIILDSTGRLGKISIWQQGGVAVKFIFTDANNNPIGVPIDQVPGINDTTTLQPLIQQLVNQAINSQNTQFFVNLINSTITQAYLGAILYPQTAVEIAAGVTPTNTTFQSGPYRYGATGGGTIDDTTSWNNMGKVAGYHIIPDGTYLIKSKVQTSTFISYSGWTRQNTILKSGGIANGDYLFEIGNQTGGSNPNVGLLERVKFNGATGDKACLHMNTGSHMWRLNELIFQSSPCTAIVHDNCFDANYTNIDILSCGTSTAAAVQIINSSNNLYIRGLRVEQCPGGCISLSNTALAIWIYGGKCDQGFITQAGPAVSVDSTSQLNIDDYTITGVAGQATISVQGELRLGKLTISGGNNGIAHILDRRSWSIVNGISNPTFSATYWGPKIGELDLGQTHFGYAHPSVPWTTPAAVNSKQNVRAITQVTVISSTPSASTTLVGTNIPMTINNQYIGCYLVHNPTGTLADGRIGSRRLIIQSFVGGNVVVQGGLSTGFQGGLTPDSEWSLEYAGGHYTQISSDNALIDPNMTLFHILLNGISVSSPVYSPTNSGSSNAGMTLMNTTMTASQIADYTGMFLIDTTTGEPYLIGYGADSGGKIAVLYDVTGSSDQLRQINTNHQFAIQAGYNSGIRRQGDNYVWQFAGQDQHVSAGLAQQMGYDQDNLPLWGVGTPSNGQFTAQITSANGTPNITFEYNVSNGIVTLRTTAQASGTASAASLTIGPLPSFLTPSANQTVPVVGIINNGNTSVLSGIVTAITNGTLAFGLSVVSGSNIAIGTSFSGTIGLLNNTIFSYPLK